MNVSLEDSQGINQDCGLFLHRPMDLACSEGMHTIPPVMKHLCVCCLGVPKLYEFARWGALETTGSVSGRIAVSWLNLLGSAVCRATEMNASSCEKLGL